MRKGMEAADRRILRMRQASVEIDAIVAVAIFLLFIAWAFSYYYTITDSGSYYMSDTLNAVNNKLMDYLKPAGYNVPLRYYSSTIKNGSILYFDYQWEFGKQTTRIYKKSTLLPCLIAGNRVYFIADIVTGDNYFSMYYANATGTGCDSSFSPTAEFKADVFVREREDLVSQERIDAMKAISYENFKKQMGIGNDFRVEINVSGVVSAFGKELGGRNIYSKTTLSRVMETGQDIRITVQIQ